MSKTITRDVGQGELVPSRELLEGKVTKQKGQMKVNGDLYDYFMERIPGSEGPVDIMTDQMDVLTVEGAVFEVYLKDDEGNWEKVEEGLLPIDMDLYDVDGPRFLI